MRRALLALALALLAGSALASPLPLPTRPTPAVWAAVRDAAAALPPTTSCGHLHAYRSSAQGPAATLHGLLEDLGAHLTFAERRPWGVVALASPAGALLGFSDARAVYLIGVVLEGERATLFALPCLLPEEEP